MSLKINQPAEYEIKVYPTILAKERGDEPDTFRVLESLTTETENGETFLRVWIPALGGSIRFHEALFVGAFEIA